LHRNKKIKKVSNDYDRIVAMREERRNRSKLSTVSIKDFHNYYKEHTSFPKSYLNQRLASKVFHAYNKEMVKKAVYLDQKVRLPAKLGKVYVRRQKNSFEGTAYAVIDFAELNKLKKKYKKGEYKIPKKTIEVRKYKYYLKWEPSGYQYGFKHFYKFKQSYSVRKLIYEILDSEYFNINYKH
jgi:hypothetical protein